MVRHLPMEVDSLVETVLSKSTLFELGADATGGRTITMLVSASSNNICIIVFIRQISGGGVGGVISQQLNAYITHTTRIVLFT